MISLNSGQAVGSPKGSVDIWCCKTLETAIDKAKVPDGQCSNVVITVEYKDYIQDNFRGEVVKLWHYKTA